MISAMDQLRLGQIISNFTVLRTNMCEQFRFISETCSKMTRASGPTTFLRMSDFFCEGGDVFGKIRHFNLDNTVYKKLEPLWNVHIKNACAPIDTAIALIHKESNNLSGFFVASPEMVQDYINSNIPSIYRRFVSLLLKSRVSSLGYLWIKHQETKHIWVICLRKTKNDEPFTDYEKKLMLNLAQSLVGASHYWYLPILDLMDKSTGRGQDFFSERQTLMLHYLSHHLTRVECADRLCVSANAVDKYCEDIYRKTKSYLGLNGDAKMTFNRLANELGLFRHWVA